MTAIADDRKLREQIRRIDGLLQEVDRFKDPEARVRTREIVQVLMDLHGAGLERILEILASAGEPGLAQIDALAQDDLAASLLLLYGLHPQELETRVLEALEKVRPYLHSHGGNVELLGISNGVIRLRLQGSCHGCPSSALTLKQTIEEAIYEKAPDAAGIEVEGEIEHHEAAAAARAEPVYGKNGKGRVALPILAR